MPDPEVINTNPEVAHPEVGKVPVEGEQITPAKETLYAINYRGQEEKLPMAKLIDYAQQGRDYSEKMGRFNAEVEARAQELTDAAVEKFYQTPTNPPVADPNNPPAELDEFTRLQKDVETLKNEGKEKEERAAFEKEVEKERGKINDQLTKAKEKYPLMNERNVLAVLRSNPQADLMELARYEHDLEKNRRDSWEKEFLTEAEKRGKRGAEGAGGNVPATTGKKIGWSNTQEAVRELLDKQN